MAWNHWKSTHRAQSRWNVYLIGQSCRNVLQGNPCIWRSPYLRWWTWSWSNASSWCEMICHWIIGSWRHEGRPNGIGKGLYIRASWSGWSGVPFRNTLIFYWLAMIFRILSPPSSTNTVRTAPGNPSHSHSYATYYRSPILWNSYPDR